jgi:hypothetical protein
MGRPARQMELDDVRDELLRGNLLRLIAYFTEQSRTAITMRDQLILLAHGFGARPKDIAVASDLTATRVHQVIKELKDQRPNTDELVAKANQLIQLEGGKG